MIEFGKTLRQAREAKGLSIAQIADATHMMSQIVEGLENEDFSRIVAPIYGRGFVKLYCEAVGLEPKELITEFMEIYTGKRKATIRVREVPQEEDGSDPAVDNQGQKDSPPVPSSPQQTTFDQPVGGVPVDEPDIFLSTNSASTPRVEDNSSTFEFPVKSEQTAKQPIKRTFKMPEMAMPDVPPSLWRMATLVGVIIIVLWVAFIGVRALYRATMTAPDTEKVSTTSEVAPSEEKAVQTSAETSRGSEREKVKRKPMSIPPLYID